MRLGYLCIEVLAFLKGQPWDDLAKAYVHGLRPSIVRVSTGEIKSDARLWRITVFMDTSARIVEITQEIEVELPAGFEHGHALASELDRRSKSGGHQ